MLGKELDVTGNVLITGDLVVDDITIDGTTITGANETLNSKHSKRCRYYISR